LTNIESKVIMKGTKASICSMVLMGVLNAQ